MAAENEITEDFGPYKIVVRTVNGTARAVIWGGGKKLLETSANTLEEARAQIERDFVRQRTEACATDNGETVERMVSTLLAVWPRLTAAQQRMLIAQYHAPGRRLTAPALGEAGGFKDYRGANRWYGEAGLLIWAEYPAELLWDAGRQSWVYSSRLSRWVPDASGGGVSGHWQMRPEVAAAMAAAGLVNVDHASSHDASALRARA